MARKIHSKVPPVWFKRLTSGDKEVAMVVISATWPGSGFSPELGRENQRDLSQLWDFVADKMKVSAP